MGKNKEKLNIFLLHFLERLNSNEPNERKVIESLTDFCNYYDFTKGFIYQTDGFRYFLLKETIGNEGGTMKPRFDMGELKKEHVDAMKARDKPFYGNRNADASWDDIDILDFYGEDSLLIRHFEDTEGKIIGFIGFAGREEETYLTEEELQIIHLLLGSFSKEIAVREYKEREVRASNTLGSIMNNMGVDFTSTLSIPTICCMPIGLWWNHMAVSSISGGKNAGRPSTRTRRGSVSSAQRGI